MSARKKLNSMYGGGAALLAGTGAFATVAAHRASEVIWRRMFNEDPPE